MSPHARQGSDSNTIARRALLVCVALFVGLEVPAMLLYPGGTWWEPARHGVSFWQNYLCDLLWHVALNGQPNPGAHLALGAMLTLVLAFVPFWHLAARGRVARALGFVSVAGMIAVPLLPSERFGAWHGVAVVVAGVPGLTAAVLTSIEQLRRRERVAGALGAGMLVFAMLDFVLYVRTLLYGGPGPRVLPVAQRLAVLLLLAWMVVVALRPRDATETSAAP